MSMNSYINLHKHINVYIVLILCKQNLRANPEYVESKSELWRGIAATVECLTCSSGCQLGEASKII